MTELVLELSRKFQYLRFSKIFLFICILLLLFSEQTRSILISSVLHTILVFITAVSLPFLAKKPIDLPPIISVELIQITEETNIPFAPKAKKILEKIKEEEKKLVVLI